MRARERLYERPGYGGVNSGGEPPTHNSDPRDLDVEYVGVFAGRGAPEVAAMRLGGDIALLIEVDSVARTMLSRKFLNALIVADFDDEDWRCWRRSSAAALSVLTGPQCGPYAPTDKGIILDDPRARYLLGIGTAACAL